MPSRAGRQTLTNGPAAVNFAFDIDGTITAAPKAYGAMMTALVAAGHEVHALTGQTTPITDADIQGRVRQLEALGTTDFTHLAVVGPPDWVAAKANYCREHDICFVFENDVAYAQAISAACPVTVMWVHR